jgi:hypothetical protein
VAQSRTGCRDSVCRELAKMNGTLLHVCFVSPRNCIVSACWSDQHLPDVCAQVGYLGPLSFFEGGMFGHMSGHQETCVSFDNFKAPGSLNWSQSNAVWDGSLGRIRRFLSGTLAHCLRLRSGTPPKPWAKKFCPIQPVGREFCDTSRGPQHSSTAPQQSTRVHNRMH